MSERKNKSAAELAVRIAIICISAAAAVCAVLVIIKKWAEIKAALCRVRDSVVYTCDDFANDDCDDIFCCDDDDCDCCDCEDEEDEEGCTCGECAEA